MNEFDLLVDLHKYNRRQGPGSPRRTEKAVELTGLLGQKNLRIADIGCGTVSAKLEILENQGFKAIGNFILKTLSLKPQNIC